MAWTDSIARYGKIVWYFRLEVTLPLVCTQDIAEVAATELLSPSSEPQVVHEVGAEDLTKPQMAEVISREIGKPVEAVTVPTDKPDIREEFVRRFGTDGSATDQVRGFYPRNLASFLRQGISRPWVAAGKLSELACQPLRLTTRFQCSLSELPRDPLATRLADHPGKRRLRTAEARSG